MSTSLQQRLGIALPLIQAPLAGCQGSAMVIAVSNAGALGSLPAAMLQPEALRGELAAIKAATSKPFNVNFFCHTQPEADAERESIWRAALAPYFAEFGIDPASIAAGPGRLPFDDTAADLLDEFKPAVVSFHFGLPSPEMLARARRHGAIILSSATTVEEGLWLQANGADAVIAQGLEAGGHRGMFLTEDVSTQLGTMALVPQLVRALKVPVIAAGGIADANGVAAAMALGAAGVSADPSSPYTDRACAAKSATEPESAGTATALTPTRHWGPWTYATACRETANAKKFRC